MSRFTKWTDAAIEQFKTMLDAGKSYREISKALGLSYGCLIEGCKRFGFVQAEPVTTPSQIIKACKVKAGLNTPALSELLSLSESRVRRLMPELVRSGQIYKEGSPRWPQYFTDPEDAHQYSLVYKLECEKKAALALIKRKERLAGLKDAYPDAKRVRQSAKKVEPKPERVSINITNRAKEPAIKAAPAAKIVWPEHVKVQVHPTPPSRFDFTPPPGWRGEISKDWMNRRLGAAS